jgi:regulatory protein
VRKIKERGWGGARDPDIESLVRRFADLGYIDDEAFAVSKARALSGRGYGKRRLVEKLRAAGVDEADRGTAEEHADGQALESALRFAERRRLGPFAAQKVQDPKRREKDLAAMVRAGHNFSLARAIIALPPGDEVDREALRAETRWSID